MVRELICGVKCTSIPQMKVKEIMAPFKLESAVWKAETTSVKESIAVWSTLANKKDTFVST